MTIQEIKDGICIVELVCNYTELTGRGNRLRAIKGRNPIRSDGSGDFDVYQNTQKFYDQGTGEGGDVVDFIEKVENLSKADALSFLQEKYIGRSNISTSRPIIRMKPKPIKKNNDFLLAQLEIKANKYLTASHHKYRSKWSYVTLDIDGVETEVVRVAPYLEKLFEGYLIPTDQRFAEYLFNRVIGYDSYFDCPIIVIRDESETVVDIVRYRPHRKSFTDLPKYLYTKGSEKPDSNYLFPLQAQMQKMALKEGYCFVGEGLKNALNASMMGIPFISIEGAGNIKLGLIKFLKSPRIEDIVLIGAFDGDEAGESAFKRMSAEIPMQNEFSFDSGIDFAEYIKEIR